MNMQAFKDQMALATFGITITDAHAQGICVQCKKPPTHSTEAGKVEYKISGLCEPCFDDIMRDPEDVVEPLQPGEDV